MVKEMIAVKHCVKDTWIIMDTYRAKTKTFLSYLQNIFAPSPHPHYLRPHKYNIFSPVQNILTPSPTSLSETDILAIYGGKAASSICGRSKNKILVLFCLPLDEITVFAFHMSLP